MSENARPEEETGWSKRKLRLALLCSLAINLLGVGLIGGAIISGGPPRPYTEYGLKSFARSMPPERGDILRQAIESHRPKIRELREAARAARLEATDVLVAPNYDKPKLRESLVRIDDAETKLRTLVSDIFLDAAEKLTPEERRALAEWWKKRQPRLFWRPGDPGAPLGAAPASPAANN